MTPLSRRQLLALLASGAALPPSAWAGTDHRSTLLAAWQNGAEQHIGLLSVGDTQWSVQRSLVVPTRAHGLWAEADGGVLAVARRPGDWLLRWQPASGRTQWHWIGADRRFNGHVIARADGATLWTTETDLDTAQGRLGVRDANSLEKTADWATHGMDPHQLLALPQALGALPAGTLVVANGGIPTLPETGRSKRALDRMDASLVALDPGNGALLGQWRLADPRLSLRHLAWDKVSGLLGVALQAEHGDPAQRAAAPVLALFDGQALRPAQGQPPLAGYGGDICALPGGGFAVSCPRADTVALFDDQAGGPVRWRGGLPLRDACALAAVGSRWLAAGAARAVRSVARGPDGVATPGWPQGLLPDNHWVAWDG